MNLLIKHKNRESNFELLRILAMFLIVLHHCNVHGIFNYWHHNFSILHHINNFISLFLSSGGKVGVTLFVLLTGYFSCQQSFKLQKWLSVYLQMLFYSILILLFCFWVNPEQAESHLIQCVFPLTHNAYWFITSWLLLYSFSPLLNVILQSVSKQNIQNYLILGFIIWLVLPIFGIDMGWSVLLYFMYLYLLGGALKLNLIDLPPKIILFLLLSVLCWTMSMMTSALCFWEHHIHLWNLYSFDLNTLYTLFVSLFIFYIFKDLKIKSPMINWIATSMFGVYLLHDNNLIRPWLWHTFLQMDTPMESPQFGIIALIVSISVFGLCIVIDKVLSLFYKPLIQYIENKLSKIAVLKKYF